MVIHSRYAGSATLCVKAGSGVQQVPVRIVQSLLKQYRVEVLESVCPFTAGQITSVPKGSVRFAEITQESLAD